MRSITWYDGYNSIQLSPLSVCLIFGIESILITLVFYVLRTIGLYTLAKKDGFKKLWMVFIPFLWIYVAGKLAGTVIFRGKPIKNFALIVTIIFATYSILDFACEVLSTFPLIGYYLQGGEIYLASKEVYDATLSSMGYAPYYFSDYFVFVKTGAGGMKYPYDYLLVGKIITAISSVSGILSIVGIVLEVTLYAGLFRKYWPERYLLATVLSVFGLFAPFVFAIRKRKAVKYEDFVRRKYYGAYGNPFNNGVNQNQQQRNTKEPENPFEEFSGDRKDDVFSEFDEKK